jgi:5-methyltetrahydrofolate--homocysteine methyltransferase
MTLLSSVRFWEHLRSGVVLLSDGAVGSELIRRGLAPEDVLAANSGLPSLVQDIHDGYIGSGADIITSNTFGLRNGKAWASEFRAGAAIAVQSARTSIREIGVWLSMPAAVASRESETIEFLQQSAAAWPGMILVETCISLREAQTALESAALLRPDVIAVTAHFRSDGNMPDGTTPEEFAQTMERGGAHIVGANCGDTPEHFIEITSRMKDAVRIPLLIQPSAGLPERDASGQWRYPVDADRFSVVAAHLVEAGANIIGGCCGTFREHIRALRQSLPFQV